MHGFGHSIIDTMSGLPIAELHLRCSFWLTLVLVLSTVQSSAQVEEEQLWVSLQWSEGGLEGPQTNLWATDSFILPIVVHKSDQAEIDCADSWLEIAIFNEQYPEVAVASQATILPCDCWSNQWSENAGDVLACLAYRMVNAQGLLPGKPFWIR
mmetsp:Transcript_14344/g.22243  ORF Transcript_14344/g.22243 Transcript_14344/m.22243 type:complete len:154 (-) Transcript_14344:1067-1528(-)